LAIIVASDKGLAGALNTNVLSKVDQIIMLEGNENLDFITIGKRSSQAVLARSGHVFANFSYKDRDIKITDAAPIAALAQNEFVANHYGKVLIVYTHFISTLGQKAEVLQLLPFASESEKPKDDYLIEPDREEALNSLATAVLEFAVFQALLEAAASEHSARMVAMRNANDAALDLMTDLKFSYNQNRQASITRELSEISAAKLALEN
jgi:F-type H+-transporting ATPase subunit gamma